MEVLVPWIVDYNRYYRISAEEYHLYQNDSQAFCQLYEKEISRNEECFTQKFIGAGALRDYDGRVHFTRAYPSKEVNPFLIRRDVYNAFVPKNAGIEHSLIIDIIHKRVNFF
mgnify:CR=1 FL=1